MIVMNVAWSPAMFLLIDPVRSPILASTETSVCYVPIARLGDITIGRHLPGL